MDVRFTTYPIQEWILDTDTWQLGNIEPTLDAIVQDVKFALSTERNKYPIMGPNFGVTFDDLIGQDMTYVRAQVKRRILDALSIDDRIQSITSFEFETPEPGTLVVSFLIETVLGKEKVSTEIITA